MVDRARAIWIKYKTRTFPAVIPRPIEGNRNESSIAEQAPEKNDRSAGAAVPLRINDVSSCLRRLRGVNQVGVFLAR